MERSGMPGRAARMRLCGKRYETAEDAAVSKAMLAPGAVIDGKCPCKGFHVSTPRTARVVLAVPRRATGFPARVKLAVRTRAGNGDADAAVCEACGLDLGRRGGQVHHLIDRGMGGCKDPVINSAANAALLCGIPQDKTTCHGLATAFDAGIGERGFWLKRGTDLLAAPMILHDGRRMLRTADGRYLDAPGAVAA